MDNAEPFKSLAIPAQAGIHALSVINDQRRAWAPGIKGVAIKSAFPFVVFFAALSSGCAVVETGASVVKATASVASATVGVASTVVGTTVVAGSAAVSAASAAKSVTVATAGVAVAAGSLVVTGVQLAANARRADDVATVTVVAAAPDRFVASDGRRWITNHCADVVAGQPALWVAMRSGETVVRTAAGNVCPVLAME